MPPKRNNEGKNSLPLKKARVRKGRILDKADQKVQKVTRTKCVFMFIKLCMVFIAVQCSIMQFDYINFRFKQLAFTDCLFLSISICF